jgi:hypothetical protein
MRTAGKVQSAAVQNPFRNDVQVTVLRSPGGETGLAQRPFLVFLAASHQVGPFAASSLASDRNFDLAIRYYHPPQADDPLVYDADYVLTGGLSKFHAAKQFIETTGVLSRYDGFLFLDGDISFEDRDMEKLLDMAASGGFALAQAGLTPDSYFSWEITLARPAFEYRETSFVEVMAPYVSRQALASIIHTFDQSISSHGLDRVWPHLLRGQRIGVIDAVRMRHALPINRKGGAFYTYLKSIGVDEGKEQRDLLRRYGVPKVRPHDVAGYRKALHDPDTLERIPLARLPYPIIRYSHRLDAAQTWLSTYLGTVRTTTSRVASLSRQDDHPAAEITGH